MKKSLLVLFLFSIAITTASAECTKSERIKMIDGGYSKEEIESICLKDNEEQLSTSQQRVDAQEEWYFKLGFGQAWVKYPKEKQNVIDIIESNPNVERTTVAVDIGFYWPLGTQSLLGFNISGSGDRFEYGTTNMQINLYNYALSYIYNINKIRDGFFLRGDIGIAKALVDTSFAGSTSSDSGVGIGVGLGYAFELGGWGISPEFLVNSYQIEGESYSSSQLLVNFMF